MHVITGRNINEVWNKVVYLMRDRGERSDSRNGPVMVVRNPVTLQYLMPCERVLFDPRRDANPFFHLLEAMWMLAGRNDVAWLDWVLPDFKRFSDDGKSYYGAYGFRWREWFDYDQLGWVIKHLKENPKSRRAVVGMYDPYHDSETGDGGGKDIPCNLSIKFDAWQGALDMCVFNRSNDAIMGACGANAVHMSFLQEYIAGMIGIPVGHYYQISANFHVYEDTWDKKVGKFNPLPATNYELNVVAPFTLIERPFLFDDDLKAFMNDDRNRAYGNSFFICVAVPMFNAYRHWKNGDRDKAISMIAEMPLGNDWSWAAMQWMQRRSKVSNANA